MEFLTGFISYIVPFLLVLTVVVFFHELGHFLVARWNKVDVEAFAVGFGPEIFGFNDRNGTRWKLCAIPLGGYVKFLGDANAASVPDFEGNREMSDAEKAGSFEHKTVGQRAAVVAAGPIANFILAIIIFAGSFYFIGRYVTDPVVSSVLEESAAKAAGVQPGDQIVAINGLDIESFSDIPRIVGPNHGIELQFTLLRDGNELTLPITPKLTERTDQFGNKINMGVIGITSETRSANPRRKEFGVVEAFSAAVGETVYIVQRTFQFLGGVFTGRESADQLSGPIGIAKAAGDFYSIGWPQLVYLAGLLSVSIGLLNLFPIPLLDGGHLVFYAAEAIRGTPVPEKVQEISFRVGFLILIGFMLFATRNDLVYRMPWSG